MPCICQGTFQEFAIFPMTGDNTYGDAVIPESGMSVIVKPAVESTTKRGNGGDWCQCDKITYDAELKLNPYCMEFLEAIYGSLLETDVLVEGMTKQCFGFGQKFNDFGIVAVADLAATGGDLHFVIHRARATGFPEMGPQDDCAQEWTVPVKILKSQDPEASSDNNAYCVLLHEGTAVPIPAAFPGLTNY